MKKKIVVEIRCQKLELEFKFMPTSTSVDLGTIKGFKRVFDEVKSHFILSYIDETNNCRIDVFAKEVGGNAKKPHYLNT